MVDKWNEGFFNLKTMAWELSEDPEVNIEEEREGNKFYKTLVDQENLVIQITQHDVLVDEPALWIYWRTEE